MQQHLTVQGLINRLFSMIEAGNIKHDYVAGFLPNRYGRPAKSVKTLPLALTGLPFNMWNDRPDSGGPENVNH